MKRRGTVTVLVVVGAGLLIGCASAQKEVATEQVGADRADRAAGTAHRIPGDRVVSGKEEVYTLVAKTAETETWISPSGCRAVYPRTGLPGSVIYQLQRHYRNPDGQADSRDALPPRGGWQVGVLVRGQEYAR